MEAIYTNCENLFSHLPHTLIQRIENKKEQKRFRRGGYIFQDFETASKIFFVKEGIVKISKNNPSGKKVVIEFKKTGESIGLGTLFLPNESFYQVTAQAMTSVRVEYIQRSELESIIMNSPDLAKKVIKQMSSQLRNYSTLIKDYTLNDVYGKTIKALERLGFEYGHPIHGQDLAIDLPISNQELANIVGSSRETVSRIVTKLKEENILCVNHKRIKINDWSNFCSLAEKY